MLRISLLSLLIILLPSTSMGTSAGASTAVERLQRYLQIDTSNPPGGEASSALYLARLLNQAGVGTLRLVSPAGRTSLYARLEAKNVSADDRGAVLLLHHMDVVPAGSGWDKDPFSGEIDNGKIWGRGAIDAKSLGIAHLEAFLALAERSEDLTRDVIYLGAADEERGGGEGVGWLVDAHPELFDDVDVVLNEAGMNRVIDERTLWWGIEVAQKRPLWLEVTARGTGGHGSGFNPGNPAQVLVAGLARVLELEHTMRVTEASLVYFKALARLHGQRFEAVFSLPDVESVQAALDEAVADGNLYRVLLPGMHTVFLDTVQLTALDTGGNAVNVVPPLATAKLDARLLPDTDAEALLERIKAALGPGLEVDVLLDAPVTPLPNLEHPDYLALVDRLSPSAPVVPVVIPGTTDSRYFRERGIAAYGFSPFLLTGPESRGIHGANESIPVDAFLDGVERMGDILRALATSESSVDGP